MFRKLLSMLVISSIILVSSTLAFGKQKGDWSSVQNLVNQEVAVKLKGGKMHYGMVKSADSNGLTLQVVSDRSFSKTETTFNQSEISKVWRALLFVNERNTGKGALIGAGVGALALGVPAVAGRSGYDEIETGLAGAAFLLGALGGAAIGGIAGFFAKSKHKKRDLVFQQ